MTPKRTLTNQENEINGLQLEIFSSPALFGESTPKRSFEDSPAFFVPSDELVRLLSKDELPEIFSMTDSSRESSLIEVSPPSSSSSHSMSVSPPPSPPLSSDNEVPNGLKFYLASPFSISYVTANYEGREVLLNRYLYVRNKRFGVEPGFEGVKLWTPEKSALLRAEDLEARKPKYYQAISEFFVRELAREPRDPVIEELAKEAGFLQFGDTPSKFVIDYIRTSNNAHINTLMDAYARENILKFHKLHFIKLDYPEPDSGSDQVSIPLDRCKKISDKLTKTSPRLGRFLCGLGFVDDISQRLHQKERQGTIREMNLGAVKEALANDLYEAWGFGGQNLRIIHTRYRNGRSKLLLDGAEVQGRRGEAFRTFDGQIKLGYLEGNCVRGEDGLLYPIDSRELGRAKVMALLMGDFDKVGSGGGNLGFVIEDGRAILKNIDPGKALESPIAGRTDRMIQQDLHTDLSFDQPIFTLKDKAAGGYKNFTIFDDTLLSERVQGMQDVLNAWSRTCSIFESYIQAFDGSEENDDLNFIVELQEAFGRLSSRKNYFEQVLHERLELLKLGSEKLDFLDNVEKLTSETIDRVGAESETVSFKHLNMIPETRKEWHMIKQSPEGQYLLWFRGSEEEVTAARVRINQFLLRDRESSRLVDTVRREEGNLLTINIENEAQLQLFMVAMSESRVAEFKGQTLA